MLSRNKLSTFICNYLSDTKFEMSKDGRGLILVKLENGNKASFHTQVYATIPEWKQVVERELEALKKVKSNVENKKA